MRSAARTARGQNTMKLRFTRPAGMTWLTYVVLDGRSAPSSASGWSTGRRTKFTQNTIDIDGNEYYDCVFDRCTLIFRAASPPVNRGGNEFRNCEGRSRDQSETRWCSCGRCITAVVRTWWSTSSTRFASRCDDHARMTRPHHCRARLHHGHYVARRGTARSRASAARVPRLVAWPRSRGRCNASARVPPRLPLDRGRRRMAGDVRIQSDVR